MLEYNAQFTLSLLYEFKIDAQPLQQCGSCMLPFITWHVVGIRITGSVHSFVTLGDELRRLPCDMF